MTRDDVIRLAREAGFTWEPINNIADPLERFATLVLEADDGPWKSAVIEQLVMAHTITAEHESDPAKAVQDLLAYHADIAVDPRVSGAASDLIEKARAEAIGNAADGLEGVISSVTCMIEWIKGGCDTKLVLKELRLLRGHLRAKVRK